MHHSVLRDIGISVFAIWLYLFIGARMFRKEFNELTGMWSRNDRIAAVVTILLWPFVDILAVFLED